MPIRRTEPWAERALLVVSPCSLKKVHAIVSPAWITSFELLRIVAGPPIVSVKYSSVVGPTPSSLNYTN